MKELARTGARTVRCRVLRLGRQRYYRWLGKPVADAVLEEVYRANTLLEAHRDDPESATGSLPMKPVVPEARMADRTTWRICLDNRWWSVFGKARQEQEGRPAGA